MMLLHCLEMVYFPGQTENMVPTFWVTSLVYLVVQQIKPGGVLGVTPHVGEGMSATRED